jgi:hypothetical protein
LPKVQLSCIYTEKVGKMDHICFYFVTGGPKRCFYWGVPPCSQKIGDGPINIVTF